MLIRSHQRAHCYRPLSKEGHDLRKSYPEVVIGHLVEMHRVNIVLPRMEVRRPICGHVQLNRKRLMPSRELVHHLIRNPGTKAVAQQAEGRPPATVKRPGG